MTQPSEEEVKRFVLFLEQAQVAFWDRAGIQPRYLYGDWHVPRVRIVDPAGGPAWSRDVTRAELAESDLKAVATRVVDDYLVWRDRTKQETEPS